MARRLTLWGIAGGVLIALLFLALDALVSSRRFMFRGSGEGMGERTRAEERDLRASSALGQAEGRLAIARHRLAIEEHLQRAGATTSLALVVDGAASGDRARTARLTAAAEAAWQDLGLGITKISVGVVVVDRATLRSWGRAFALGGVDPAALYLLPDSLAPARCIAIVVAPFPQQEVDAALRTTARSWLGPCAFYARFGIPALRVQRWLTNRQFDVAFAPDWATERTGLLLPGFSPFGDSRDWYWVAVYFMPPHAAGCLAGRVASCREALIDGDQPARGPAAAFVTRANDAWRFDRQRLTGADHFLADILQETGAARFQAFWRTALPVDSALTLALGTPAPEWTRAWESTVAPRPRFGPAPRWVDLAIALGLISLAVAIAAHGSARRQVSL